MQKSKTIIPYLFPFFLLTSFCIKENISVSPTTQNSYKIPERTNDGWQTASIEDVGLNRTIITNLFKELQKGTFENLHSLVIIKDGKLIFEEYISGYTWNYDPNNQYRGELVEFDRNTIHNLASVTKSFTSSLVGIAIEQNYIQSVNDKLFAYFTQYSSLKNSQKDKITLKHLLTMTSGMKWNEDDYSTMDNDLIQLFYVADPIKYILEKPIIHEPGTHFYYNGGNTNLLGEIIKTTTESLVDFADKNLFQPLGITNYEWDYINPEVIHASGNLKLRPRDMAKFGQLFLNEGTWKGQRIISKEWVEESIRRHTTFSNSSWSDGYGYQWWMLTYSVNNKSYPSYFAAGWGGQRISIFPEQQIVVVFTGGNYVGQEPTDEILNNFILPAVEK